MKTLRVQSEKRNWLRRLLRLPARRYYTSDCCGARIIVSGNSFIRIAFCSKCGGGIGPTGIIA